MNTAPNIVARRPDQSGHVTSVDNAAVLFSLLSNNVRLNVLLRVINREWSVGELATDLEIGQATLSHHLSKLRHGGVVSTRRKRQTIYYSCNDAAVISLLVEMELHRPIVHSALRLTDTDELRAGAT